MHNCVSRNFTGGSNMLVAIPLVFNLISRLSEIGNRFEKIILVVVEIIRHLVHSLA